MPPCLDVNCPDHTTLKPKNYVNHNDSDNDIEMIACNVNDKKSSLKRKSSKSSSDGFVFPSKTARPITPTPVLNPIEMNNSFENLEQNPEIAQTKLPEIPTLPWPARSPDLSPVDHVWDQLKRQMPSCHSVHDLELAVQDLWAHLPQDNIRCLINSIPDRVAACIAAGGGPPRYCCPVFVSLHTLYSFNCLVFQIK
ncbi:transposable element Tcb2 transposase [Trichonephila inaurata madagascariensis]|uniref:Transposable element Tcb2 transposase n=1 Tax=Trichonephila inaurata madagascariensis TaxID=2747483 RepID=A0A8X6X030_9ARAC|nr:transposable element Tcb2 transposase [Trichonephila inaurata madagascariensis]